MLVSSLKLRMENYKIRFPTKLMHVILETAGYVLLTLALIWSLPKALGLILNTRQPLAVITSNSMWPTFKRGDLILVKGIKGEVLGVSDIAVYEHENGFAIHRVVAKYDDNFITKGDANTQNDPPTNYEQLIGRAIGIGSKPLRIPFIGSIGSLLREKLL